MNERERGGCLEEQSNSAQKGEQRVDGAKLDSVNVICGGRVRERC